jgi:hypothetical protein
MDRTVLQGLLAEAQDAGHLQLPLAAHPAVTLSSPSGPIPAAYPVHLFNFKVKIDVRAGARGGQSSKMNWFIEQNCAEAV